MRAPAKVGPTASERALADVSSQQWNDYVARFRPAEAALIKKAEFTAGEKAQVKGEASADTAASFAGLARDTISKGKQAGGDANSGRTKFSLAADAESAGTAKGLAQGAAVTGGELDSEGQKLKIAGFGRKVATDVTANLSRGAQRATALAIADSQAKYERNAAMAEAVAGIAGAATRKLTMKKPLSKADADAVDEVPLNARPRHYTPGGAVSPDTMYDPYDLRSFPGAS